ncbi:MAG: oligosaccharide flippase family protein [Clostridium sp.]|jgi:O-antigen/teichoic acid export membrane protein|uniref:lipopolysaccharide biosynthesis protein n=1 Tax=Clostridium sp. TaxID=1506 RepID=UPI0025B9D0C3|nr:oligosaccharide flippase family protein [Clostridium sp.]MCH3965039.1 oligosaccharide flippase family protein [Clostridium sp.]MCI1714260.1 oligosaccharide flippase family protein [Clostridium sp.]MCI1798522.1 oligosaccharide flippase family protein [Clostridium sp.]MCI1812747.1 oligosaccharide flippase family protein [Clostridium sp.]MCI1869331.1 oligosaccharide flippase family protein [Clostridium sp.]
MSKEGTLVKNTIIYAIGNFGSKVLSFILLPFYTYYLSTNDYGYFDLITTTVALLTPIVTFQIYDGLYRYLLESKDDAESAHVISNSFFMITRNLMVFSIIYIIFIQFKSFKYEYLILLQIDFSILSVLWSQIARGFRKNVDYSVSGIISTVVILVSNILFITIMHMKVGSLIVSNILSSIIIIIYLDGKLKIHNYIKLKLNNNIIKRKLIVFSIPLIPNVISWWLMNVSDRYFLTFYKGVEANGIYAISNKFPSILIMLNTIFNLAWQESAITEYGSKDRNVFYTRMFNVLMTFQFTAVIGLLAFTKFIMHLMVNVKFESAWMFVPFLYIGTIFNSFSLFYGTGYLSSKDTIGAFYTSVIGGVINVIINIALIPVIGIQGASFSTMIAFLVMWLTRLWQTRKYFRIDIDLKRLIILSIISVLFIFTYYSNNKIVEIVIMILSVIIFVVFNKSLISKAFEFAKNKIRK